MKVMKFWVQSLVVMGLLAGNAWADQVDDEVKARLEPVGKTCMSGDECAAAPVAVATGGPKSGKEVYDSFCTTCHAAGVMSAPRFGNAGDWGPRVAKGKDTLYNHAINGFNSMPAKGMCAACSEDEIKAAVDYMADNSK